MGVRRIATGRRWRRWQMIAAAGSMTALWAGLLLPGPQRAFAAPNYPPSNSSWLAYENFYRETAALPDVAEDPALDVGDLHHVQWMLANNQVAHGEAAGSSCATTDGSTAASNSVLYGRSPAPVTAQEAIEAWMAAPFHALGILNPTTVAAGFATGSTDCRGLAPAAGQLQSAAALNVFSDQGNPSVSYPVVWPGNGSSVPLTAFSGNESPDPEQYCPTADYRGLPILFRAAPSPAIGITAASVRPRNGSPLQLCTLQPSTTAGVAQNILTSDNAAILMPHDPLVLGTTYDVSVTTNGATTTWSFTAGQGSTPPPSPTLAGVVGTDNALYVKRGGLPFQALGGGLLAAPALVAVPDGVGGVTPLYIALGGDHRLYSRTIGLDWRLLIVSAHQCLDNPAAMITGNGPYTLTVVCQQNDRALYSWTAPVVPGALPSITSSPLSLGGGLLAGPAVASVNGVTTFFAEGADHFLYSRTINTPYAQLPAQCNGHPAAANNATTAYLACQGLDGALYYSVSSGSGWAPFRSAGGLLIDGPGIALTAGGVSIFVEGTNEQLFHTEVTLSGSSASSFTSDGGRIRYGAGAVGLPG